MYELNPIKYFIKNLWKWMQSSKYLNLLSYWGRPRNFNKIKLTPLYKNVSLISTPTCKDMMELLRYIIPPMHHEYFNNLTHT